LPQAPFQGKGFTEKIARLRARKKEVGSPSVWGKPLSERECRPHLFERRRFCLHLREEFDSGGGGSAVTQGKEGGASRWGGEEERGVLFPAFSGATPFSPLEAESHGGPFPQ